MSNTSLHKIDISCPRGYGAYLRAALKPLITIECYDGIREAPAGGYPELGTYEAVLVSRTAVRLSVLFFFQSNIVGYIEEDGNSGIFFLWDVEDAL